MKYAAFVVAAFLAFAAGSASADNKSPSKTVAILVFDGVEIIDYSGPYEVFGTEGFKVFTVAETAKPVVSNFGLKVVPDYTLANMPHADIVVVPGGDLSVPKDSKATLDWIRQQAASAEHTMSVCNGAFLLARAGLLDGLTATTTYSLLDLMRQRYPSVHVVDDKRFVDNGKIITTAGLSSGIDGALHVISLEHGNGRAQQVALNLEYDWRPDRNFARAALADSHIPDDFNLDSLGNWHLVSTSGDRNHWTMVLKVQSPLSGADLLGKMASQYESHGHWTGAGGSSDGTERRWTFKDRKGENWTADLLVRNESGTPHQYDATVQVARATKG